MSEIKIPMDSTLMNVIILTTVNIGYAGIPFDVSINVDYYRTGNNIHITYWMEDKNPYDNPPDLWYDEIKEKIGDYFYELCNDCKIIFSV